MAHFTCPFCSHVQLVPEQERESIQVCSSCKRRLRVRNAPAPARLSDTHFDGEDDDPKPAPHTEHLPARGATAKFAPRKAPPPPPITSEDEDRTEVINPAALDDAKADTILELEADLAEDKGEEKSQGKIASLLGSLGALLFLAVIVLVVTGWWKTLLWQPLSRWLEQQGIPGPLAYLLVLVVLALPLAFVVLRWIKGSMLAGVPLRVEFQPIQPEEVPKLSKKQLKQYTEDFQALGFTHLLDYQVKTEKQSNAKGFGRLLAHPGHHCFAEINQVVRPDGPGAPMRCMIISWLEDGWSLGIGDREPNPYSYIMRRPKALWISQPEDAPADLLKAHLKRRGKMAKDLGVAVLDAMTAQDYFTYEQKATAERHQAMKRKNIVMALLEIWLFPKNPKYEWLGKYARRTGNKK